MATQQLQQPEGLVTQADALLKLLGGTKTTTNPGDTGALQSTLGQLQGTDYEAMLKAIFQQAGGQIPGIQQALGNAIGARSGGNSAVAAALQKLLAQTSTGAMDQVAKLQAQNFATQANIGGNIAQATKGTTQQTGTDVGGGLAQAAKLIAVLQGVKTLGADKWLKDLTSTTPEQSISPVMTTAANNAFASPTAPLSTAETPMFNLTGAFQPTAAGSAPAPSYQGDSIGIPQVTDPGFQFTDMTGFQAPYQEPVYTPSFEPTPAPVIPYDTYDETFTFADGGIVHGRDGATAPMEPDDTPAAEQTEEEDEAKSNARFDKGFTANKFLDTFRELLGNNDLGKAEGYADGGTVRAGGSRRSANPSVLPLVPETSLAQISADELRGQFEPQVSATANTPTQLASPIAAVSSSDVANSVASGSGGSYAGTSGSTSGTGMSPAAYGNTVNNVNAISNISGLTGGPSLGDAGGILGLSAGLANAKSSQEALGLTGKFAANVAMPGAGSLVSFAQDPTATRAADIGLSLAVPGYALASAGLGLFGLASPAEIAQNAYELANPNQMMTPEQEATLQAEQAAAAVQASIAANNPNSAGLTGQANAMEGDALGNLLGLTNSFGTGNTTNTTTNGSGTAGTQSGMAGQRGAGAQTGSMGDTKGDADGGLKDGPGTGISDSIPARLSDGEFVISADVVKTLGEDFFNQLQAAFHTPAVQQRARA